jgi:hypothetical protein
MLTIKKPLVFLLEVYFLRQVASVGFEPTWFFKTTGF